MVSNGPSGGFVRQGGMDNSAVPSLNVGPPARFSMRGWFGSLLTISGCLFSKTASESVAGDLTSIENAVETIAHHKVRSDAAIDQQLSDRSQVNREVPGIALLSGSPVETLLTMMEGFHYAKSRDASDPPQ